MYNISVSDVELLKQSILDLRVRITIFHEITGEFMDQLECGIISGSSTVSAESDVRRTFSLECTPIDNDRLVLNEEGIIWLNRIIKLEIGILDTREQVYTWYEEGRYVFTNMSATFDATTNTISLSCNDLVAKLDGTKNGQIGGAETIAYPAYEEIEYYAASSTLSGSEYSVPLTGYSAYQSGDIIAIKILTTNPANATMNINGAGSIPIYEHDPTSGETDDEEELITRTYPIPANALEPNAVHVFRIVSVDASGRHFRIIHIGKYASERTPIIGVPVKYNTIRKQVNTTLKKLSFVTEKEIDEIGEYKGMPQYNDDYQTYREQSKVQIIDGTFQYTWNALPYDQEFSVGSSVWSVLTTFRDLYPNYEMFFDEKGTFICQMIPSRYSDDTVLTNDFFRDVIISESTSVDLSTVRNVCEVFGKAIEADFYSETTNLSGRTYSATVGEYDEYYNGDIVALQIYETNPGNPMLKINRLSALPIYDEYTETYLEQSSLTPNTIYTFKIKSKLIDGVHSEFRAYLLGHYLPHGIDVLTDGSISSETWTDQDGITHQVFSKDYFQAKYNCECVNLTIIKDSPFTIQKLGEILDVKTGGEYENITSDALAVHRAIWENWKNCRLTDSITLSTKITPFADVNVKVEYRPSAEEVDHQYIVKNVSHDWSGGTTSWTLMKFYPLYDEEHDDKRGTHAILSKYTHGVLSRYTHSQLQTLL